MAWILHGPFHVSQSLTWYFALFHHILSLYNILNLVFHDFVLWLSKLAEAVMLLTAIQDLSGSVSDRILTVFTKGFHIFYASPDRCENNALKESRPLPLPSTFLPIYYHQIIWHYIAWVTCIYFTESLFSSS